MPVVEIRESDLESSIGKQGRVVEISESDLEGAPPSLYHRIKETILGKPDEPVPPRQSRSITWQPPWEVETLSPEREEVIPEKSKDLAPREPVEPTVLPSGMGKDYGLRPDGTPKGPGFLGELKRPDGKVSTELSIGVTFEDGKEIEIPMLVPTLTQNEINDLLSVPEGTDIFKHPTGESIAKKAIEHAKMRISQGKSPFIQEGEQPSSKPSVNVSPSTPDLEREMASKSMGEFAPERSIGQISAKEQIPMNVGSQTQALEREMTQRSMGEYATGPAVPAPVRQLAPKESEGPLSRAAREITFEPWAGHPQERIAEKSVGRKGRLEAKGEQLKTGEPALWAERPPGEKAISDIGEILIPFGGVISGTQEVLSPETMMEVPALIAYGKMLGEVAGAIKASTWFRRLFNKERAVVIQSVEETVKKAEVAKETIRREFKAKGYSSGDAEITIKQMEAEGKIPSQGEIIRKWGDRGWREKALSERMKGEELPPEPPVEPTPPAKPVKPKVVEKVEPKITEGIKETSLEAPVEEAKPEANLPMRKGNWILHENTIPGEGLWRITELLPENEYWTDKGLAGTPATHRDFPSYEDAYKWMQMHGNEKMEPISKAPPAPKIEAGQPPQVLPPTEATKAEGVQPVPGGEVKEAVLEAPPKKGEEHVTTFEGQIKTRDVVQHPGNGPKLQGDRTDRDVAPGKHPQGSTAGERGGVPEGGEVKEEKVADKNSLTITRVDQEPFTVRKGDTVRRFIGRGGKAEWDEVKVLGISKAKNEVRIGNEDWINKKGMWVSLAHIYPLEKPPVEPISKPKPTKPLTSLLEKEPPGGWTELDKIETQPPTSFRVFVQSRGEKWPMGAGHPRYQELKSEFDGLKKSGKELPKKGKPSKEDIRQGKIYSRIIRNRGKLSELSKLGIESQEQADRISSMMNNGADFENALQATKIKPTALFPEELKPLAEHLVKLEEEEKPSDTSREHWENLKSRTGITSVYNFFNIEEGTINRIDVLKKKLSEYGFAGKSPIADLRQAYQESLKSKPTPTEVAGKKGKPEPPTQKGETKEVVAEKVEGEPLPVDFSELVGRFEEARQDHIAGEEAQWRIEYKIEKNPKAKEFELRKKSWKGTEHGLELKTDILLDKASSKEKIKPPTETDFGKTERYGYGREWEARDKAESEYNDRLQTLVQQRNEITGNANKEYETALKKAKIYEKAKSNTAPQGEIDEIREGLNKKWGQTVQDKEAEIKAFKDNKLKFIKATAEGLEETPTEKGKSILKEEAKDVTTPKSKERSDILRRKLETGRSEVQGILKDRLGETPTVREPGKPILKDETGDAFESLRKSTREEEQAGRVVFGRPGVPETPGFKFSDPTIEKSYQESLPKGEPILSKVMEYFTDIWHKMTRAYENLPRNKEFAQLQFDLKKLEKQKGVASYDAIVKVTKVLSELKGEDYDLFTRKVILDDLVREAERGHELPWGFTKDSVKAELGRINGIVDQRGAIQDALAKRKEMWNTLKDEYTGAMGDIGFNVDERLKNEDYFRHQILEYVNLKGLFGTGEKLKTPTGRGFLKAREGSQLDINRDFIQPEYEVVSQMLYDIQVAKTIKGIDDNYNIQGSLKARAKGMNEAKIREMVFLPMAREVWKPQMEMSVEELADSLYKKTLNIKQAMGFGKLQKLAEDGALPDLPSQKWSEVIDSIASGDSHEGTLPYLAWVMKHYSDTEPGKAAALIFKGISGKKKYIEESLKVADQFTTWETIIPDGYTTWQPREGNIFYMTDSIPAQLADKLHNGALEELGVTKGDIKKALTMGAKRKQFVIKEEVAVTLDELVKQKSQSIIGNADRELLKAWKVWQLVSPRRHLKYNLRNLTGDADAVFVGNPRGFVQVPLAVKEIGAVLFGKKEIEGELKQFFDRGGFSSTLQTQEMGELKDLWVFERLYKDQHPGIKELPTKAWKKYWETARISTDARESVLRYSNYLNYLEQMRGDPEGKPKNFGGSKPEEIMGLSDIRDRAYWLANDLLGAYDRISVMGNALRQYVFPFWSWKEINLKRYAQFAKNAASDGKFAETVGRSAVGTLAKTPFIAYRIGKFLIAATAFWSGLQVWNHLFFPDEEDELSEDQKTQPHIVLGKDDNGKVITFNRIGALGDFLEWFGLDSAPKYVDKWFKGEMTLKEIAENMAKSPVNLIVQGATPFVKTPAELVTRRSLFPNMFQPGPIRDRGLYLARSIGLENEYKSLAGLPSKGYKDSLKNFLVYSTDPGQAAFVDIQEDKRRWLQKQGKGAEGFWLTPRGNALYNIKLALRYEDKEALDKYMLEYISLGGKKGDMNKSLERMAPLSGMSIDEKNKFKRSLNPEQRTRLVLAERFYRDTLRASRPIALRSFQEQYREGITQRRVLQK